MRGFELAAVARLPGVSHPGQAAPRLKQEPRLQRHGRQNNSRGQYVEDAECRVRSSRQGVGVP